MTKSPKEKNNISLSIIILYYNSGNYLTRCLDSIAKSKLNTYKIETVIVNNGSSDNTVRQAEITYKNHPVLNPAFVYSPSNLGFSAGNNFGLKHTNSDSEFVLFVNDDTTFFPDTISRLLDFAAKNPQADAVTINVLLSSTGKLAPETHRGFPTPWNTFWHFFGFGIPKLFPKSKLLHGYLNDYKEYNQTQQIDCCQGCFLLIKRKVGEQINWWNEKYFFLGEDLDLCYQLKKLGFRLYFYPGAKVIHYHGVSSGIKDTKSTASRATRIRSALNSTQAMRTFYRENLIHQYPRLLHWLIWAGIKILEIIRVFKAKWL